jgi:hypothetical protein
MSEDLTPEDIRNYLKEEEEEEIAERIVSRRGRPPRKKPTFEIPKDLEETLKKINGAEVLRLMHLLHNAYLSWITEAEAEKYYTVTRQAFVEALQQQQQVIRELTQSFARQIQDVIAPTLNTVTRTLDAIEARVRQIEQATSRPLIDDRLIILGGIVIKALKDKLKLPREVDELLDSIIYSTAIGYLRGKRVHEETSEPESESDQGS